MKQPVPLRWMRLASAGALSALLLGCATVEGPRDARDPLESWNRSVFRFNEAADEAVLKPAATAYRTVVPSLVRQGVTNVYANFGDAWSAVNSALQLKPTPAAHNTMRFAVNTFFGLGGLLDVAGEMGIPQQQEDLGQTLGRWGVGPGPYLVLPFLGASTLRDAAALPVDLQASPNLLIDSAATRNSLTGMRVIHTRSNLLDVGEVVEGAALDKYLFIRDGYLQRRRSQVYDGEPPEDESQVRWDLDEDEPAHAAAPGPEAPRAAAAAGQDAAAAGGGATAAGPAEAPRR